ncbi:MAG: hypothetical protein RSB38_06790, partial [Oscillospiraceae bacterium]
MKRILAILCSVTMMISVFIAIDITAFSAETDVISRIDFSDWTNKGDGTAQEKANWWFGNTNKNGSYAKILDDGGNKVLDLKSTVGGDVMFGKDG